MTEPTQQQHQHQRLARSNTTPSSSRISHKARHSIGGYDTAGIKPQQQQITDQTLYSHPSVKVVKFEPPKSAASASTSSPAPSSSLPDLDYPVDAVETLPWRVSTERIAALGALRLESMASTTFLKIGSVIQPLLKNCQGWCVDGKSIFVLRIRRLTYYRIELPDETGEDKHRVESFKEALAKIIRYEVTPCPFQRGFSVDLPEEAKTPRRRKAWTPKHSPSVRKPQQPDSEGHDSSSDAGERETSDSGSVDEGSDVSASQVEVGRRNRSRASICVNQVSIPASIPSRSLTRAVTEPPSSFDSLVMRFQEEDPSPVPEVKPEENLVSSVPSSPSPSSPTPFLSRSRTHYTEEDMHISPFRSHNRDLSDATVTSQQTLTPEGQDWFTADISSPSVHQQQTNHPPSPTAPEQPPQPTLVEGDSSQTIRQRRQVSGSPDLSPPSPGLTLLSPPPRSPTHTATRTILRKTISLILDVPIHLMLLILRYVEGMAMIGPKHDYANNHDDHERDETSSEDDFGNPVTSSSSRDGHRGSPTDPRPPGAWYDLD